ncbi:HAD family hydrolase [Acuticoccus sp. M5D2P5]|uniref:HAD family hydrolase n=1 Tax=Acuticoccus kalidii TaxID=2910977 RepID=UPI001F1803C5|nr:HAD family hydrolase [Acuticoccus kalidii]MCF3935336.1 HAD family hydrolase [Acuticoccus kalidii]
MTDLLILDCDGVLVDSERLSAEATSRVLAEAGRTVSVDQILAAYVGMTDAAMWTQVARDWDIVVDDGHRARHDHYLEALFTTSLRPVCDEVHAVLGALGLPMCVASNSGHDRLRMTLGTTGLAPLFVGRIFSAEDVARGKPAPDLILHAAATMNVDPRDCLFVDDSVAGVTAGVAAGVTTIGFCGGTHGGTDHAERLMRAGAVGTVTNFHEIAALVGRAGAFTTEEHPR